MILKRILFIVMPLSLIMGAINFIDLNLYKTYYQYGYKSSSSFVEQNANVSDEIILGYWLDVDKILVAKKFSKGYFLVQRDPQASYYVGRGKNLLNDSRTKITNTSFRVNSLKSNNSDLGGLFEPANFPVSEMQKLGFTKTESGEWIKPSLDVAKWSTVESLPNGFIKYSLPTANNSTNWSTFSDLKVPEGITNVAGYGFPLYKDEKIVNGRVDLLNKGFTNVANLEGFPRKYWSPENGYYFNQLYFLLKEAAREMVKSGKTSKKYGNIVEIANMSNDNPNIPYYGLTIEGAKELGRNLFKIRCCKNSIDNESWTIPANESVLMIDEESMTPYKWEGGDHYAFLGYLNEGLIAEAGPKMRIFWYAQPVSRWFHGVQSKGLAYLSKSDIESSFSDKQIINSTPGWKNSTWYVDANGAYSKVPYLSGVDIYKKKDGVFVLDRAGMRVFRDDNFNLKIFNQNVSILSTPHDYIRYNLMNPTTGERKFGREYVDIKSDGSATIKKEYQRKGFNWEPNGASRPYPQYWEPETKMFVDGLYRRADGIMADLMLLSRLEKGTWTPSKANQKYKLYGEHRPKTEPWTFGGNSIDSREVGESQIFFDTFMLLMSGGQALSTWDDGFWRKDLPKLGQNMYESADYWGRYSARLAAVQTVLKPLEGSKSKDWTYIHFYYPYWGGKNSEVISSGIYYKNKFYVFFLNPTLENGEKQILKLRVGGQDYTIDLVGHEVYYKSFDVPTNLSPKDFKLDYTTIYGRKVKVNGVVTNKIDEHYEM